MIGCVEIGAGGHRFADSEKMEVANNFITAYEQDAMLARRIPPLTDEQRQARIDVVRTTNDEFDMNQAADEPRTRRPAPPGTVRHIPSAPARLRSVIACLP